MQLITAIRLFSQFQNLSLNTEKKVVHWNS